MDIKMPQLGESVTEGTIAKWLVQPGDQVSKYQPIAEVITDKVNAEIPAPADGVVESLEVSEGATVAVGTLIARMRVEGEEAAGTAAPGAGAAAPTPAPATATSAGGAGTGPAVAPAGSPDGPAAQPPAATTRAAVAERPATVTAAASGAGGAAAPGAGDAVAPGSGGAGGPVPGAANGEHRSVGGRYSPAVMRLAQEHGVDLNQIRGTGLGGRITRRDVERYLEDRTAGRVPARAEASDAQATPVQAGAPGAASQAALSPAVPAAPAVAELNGDQRLPVGPVRRRIAERMLQAKHEQPHAWTMVRADVTGLVALRNALKAEFKAREGVDLTFLPFMIKAVAESLREFPMLNSVWAGDEIVVRREINISIAVATEDALVVPVIKNADRLSITGLAHAIAGLAARARAGRLTLDDIQGGTFTVNNTGAFGSVMSAPILNYPQAAIITMESIVKEPVVLENDAIAIRSMVNLCLSLDHRVLDGLVCGRFLQAVKGRLEAYQPGQNVL